MGPSAHTQGAFSKQRLAEGTFVVAVQAPGIWRTFHVHVLPIDSTHAVGKIPALLEISCNLNVKIKEQQLIKLAVHD